MKKHKLVVSNYKCPKTNLIFKGMKNEFTSGCRYIAGDPKTQWHQCGHDLFNKTSWCKTHLAVVFDPTVDKRVNISGYAKRRI